MRRGNENLRSCRAIHPVSFEGSGQGEVEQCISCRQAIAAAIGILLTEIDPTEGVLPGVHGQHRAEVMRWRKLERQRIIEARLALPSGERHSHTEAIASHLDETLGDVRGRTVGVYWPFRGEPNLRRWMEQLHMRGGLCALPVVLERHAPLVFRLWQPGARMMSGIWNIPVPADGGDVVPDIVVAPVVGFDPECFRLGYGGGFYDRTLAAMARRPRVIGVGFSQAAVPTIHPLPHDIPMHVIVTERGSVER